MPRRRLSALCSLALAACSPANRDVEIVDVRERIGPAPRFDASSDERFGATARMHADGAAAPFAFELPDGWAAVPPAPRRDVDLRTASGVAVWISRLGGDGGGTLANLNRWRLQLGLPPVDDAAVAALPRMSLLGGTACRVELDGADGATRLLGLMAVRPGGSVFVRMSGPRELVDAEVPAFAAFVSTLREQVEPQGFTPSSSADGLAWTAPASWFALPQSQFRLAHFRVAPAVEAWVSVLAEDGGGLAANVARWCEQVGREPPDPAELAALPRVDVLGRAAPFVDLTGADDRRGMYAVVCQLDDRTVFVKMDGTSAALPAHRAEFLSFCASLRSYE